MPIYEYTCPECRHRFELLRPMGDSREATCPQCGAVARRALSLFAALSKSSSGETRPIAGTNPCSTCSLDSCSTCNLG